MNKKRNFNNSETINIEITPYWLLGFTEGDCSFFVTLNKLELHYNLAQAESDLLLFYKIKEYLLNLPLNVNNLNNVNINISSMSSKNENNVVQIKISDTAFLNEIIIPFFKDLQFITKKGKDFKDLTTIMEIKKLSLHKTKQGKELITEIVGRKNNNRLSTNSKNLTLSENERIVNDNILDSKIKQFFSLINLEIIGVDILDFSNVLLQSNIIVNSIKPIKTYNNAKTQKSDIINDNKNKAGIYLWFINGKTYVGSSVNLKNRFINYFNPSYLSRYKKGSLIYNALLKYDYSNFTLIILEYWKKKNFLLLAREQFYLESIKPDYNLLKIAGNSIGYKHSVRTQKSLIN